MIYVDSCLVIYAVERGDDLGDRARQVLTEADSPLAASPLVMLEAMVGPMRDGYAEPQLRMWSVFDRFEMLPAEPDAYLRAARLRAKYPRLGTADALHLAIAQRAGCSRFWTNDSRLAAIAPEFAVDALTSA
ncbi:Predicted nucleic acid-binding protein, contains PIN domain [Microbacterium sp. ru370.1]|uniref:type II toxin-antitoxin system VapC family toxin n=1 Tax=unclassified Microbacterium TaxID=2609290 RepID=UPI000880B7F1|nr:MULTISPECIES: PIN domain-containing protein [unclassified Microbacterium]SDO36116.1 Predicted nucleic acid-binding protein, contains PIN domain [Microbacterium sp. ru370.1]SIT77997.1 Predicted nucleic acid-binding protein, contains PIN domain [Microbacterium sp. RU1D]